MSKKSLPNPINNSTTANHTVDWNSRFWVGKIPDYKPKSALSSKAPKNPIPSHLPKIRSAHNQSKVTFHSKQDAELAYHHLETEYSLKTEPISDQISGISHINPLQKKIKTDFSYQKATFKPAQLSKPNKNPKKQEKNWQNSYLIHPDQVKTRLRVNCETHAKIKPSSNSLESQLPKLYIESSSSSLKLIKKDSVFTLNPIEILEIDSESSDSDSESLQTVGQEIFKTILSESLYYFSQLTANEAINEALLAYLTLSSSKILSSYINEALDTIIPALSKAWYEESKEQEPSDLRDAIAEIVKEEEILRIVREVNLNIIASEITEDYTLMVPLENLIEECIISVEQGNKKRVVDVLELLIDSIIEEEWVEILAEDVINSMRMEKIWTLFPPKLQKEVGKHQQGKIVEKIVEELYFGILNDIVAGVWVSSVCEACVNPSDQQESEDEMPIPKFTSKKNT